MRRNPPPEGPEFANLWLFVLTLGLVAAFLVAGLVPNAMNNDRKADIRRLAAGDVVLEQEIQEVNASLVALEAVVANQTLTPGPPGPTGPVGPQGPAGPLTLPSARFNIPFGAGPIGGQIILASDPNPSYVNLTQPVQGIFDYDDLGGAVVLENGYELVVNEDGFYQFAIAMNIAANTSATVIMQLQPGPAYQIGTQAPYASAGCQTSPAPFSLAGIYTYFCTDTASMTVSATAGSRVRLLYVTDATEEITLSSAVSVIKLL